MELKEILIAFCEERGYEYQKNYSGRCMFRSTCFGIICSYPMRLFLELADYMIDNYEFISLEDLLGTPAQDSMGLDCIVYFPNARLGDMLYEV